MRPEPVTAPFTDSRRLTGPNLYFDDCGAVLETTAPPTPAQVDAWRARLAQARGVLAWPDGAVTVRPHRGGAALAFAAPADQLFSATEVNEWAWSAACARPVLHAPGHPATWDDEVAAVTLKAMAGDEREPALLALIAEANRRRVPCLWDDDVVSIGVGAHAQVWPRRKLPSCNLLTWPASHSIPTALVTGSNGKTTSVRLIAACCRAQGWSSAWNCSDGLFADGQLIEPGDYSGPGGARAVLRHPGAQAAVLETARGGIMRRGLAFAAADVALVTNISADHFGEYGIDDLDGLAAAKLVLARGLRGGGTLVLNADDAVLQRHAPPDVRIAWFALDGRNERVRGDADACFVAGERLHLRWQGMTHDLGAVSAMPLSLAGAARYNIANLAGAALAAAAMGVGVDAIRHTCASFGASRDDNPGRLQRFTLDGVEVLVDYAHNPEGLRGLLQVATALGGGGRLGLVLGQAGNRSDADIRALARTAATFNPHHVVLKDLDGFLRGRQPGEVPALLRAELSRAGMPEAHMETVLPELDAARRLLAWARRGDVAVLPVHSLAARAALTGLLEG
jgi:cyanophycin synthetase